MSHDSQGRAPRPIRFLFENSLFLVAGAVVALAWANLGEDANKSYKQFVDFDFGKAFFNLAPPHHGDGHGEDHGATAAGHGDQAGHDSGHGDEAGHDAGHGDQSDHAAGGGHLAATAPAGEAGHAGEPPDSPQADGDGEHAAVAPVGGSAGDSSGDGGGSAGGESDHGAPKSLFARLYYLVAGPHGLTLHFIVNDMLMALFFAIAGKEVWESLLPGGALSNPRKAATPLLATLGGIVGPAGLYLIGVLATGTWGELGKGWAVPCATDIAFSYLIARLIFGAGHPAIAFLLLLAIADDAAGLVILAIAYPQQPLAPQWLLLTVAAIGTGFAFRRMKLHSFWWYLLIPGVMSWLSFKLAGIHAALGLVPIVICMPHAHTDLGIFAREELKRDDTLNAFEHWWKNPVELILGLFGLINAGVAFGAVGTGTVLVLIGLIVGKPLGITLFTWISEKALGLQVPKGMSYRHILTLGTIAGIGFTVALFVSTAAFPNPGAVQDSVKMGALGSFLAAALAFVVAKFLRIRPETMITQPATEGVGGAESVPPVMVTTGDQH